MSKEILVHLAICVSSRKIVSIFFSKRHRPDWIRWSRISTELDLILVKLRQCDWLQNCRICRLVCKVPSNKQLHPRESRFVDVTSRSVARRRLLRWVPLLGSMFQWLQSMIFSSGGVEQNKARKIETEGRRQLQNEQWNSSMCATHSKKGWDSRDKSITTRATRTQVEVNLV